MTQTLAQRVAARLRAEMAWRGLNAVTLADLMRTNDTWVRRRTRGQYRITIDDLERFARAFEVEPGSLLNGTYPSVERAA